MVEPYYTEYNGPNEPSHGSLNCVFLNMCLGCCGYHRFGLVTVTHSAEL